MAAAECLWLITEPVIRYAISLVKIKKKTLSAAQSKAQRSRTLDGLESQATTFLKRGRPRGQGHTSLSSRRNQELIVLMNGKIVIKGDIFSTGAKWNAQS